MVDPIDLTATATDADGVTLKTWKVHGPKVSYASIALGRTPAEVAGSLDILHKAHRIVGSDGYVLKDRTGLVD